MTTTDVVIAVPMLSMLAFATLTDFRHRQILNGLSLGGAGLGLMTQATLFGPSGLALGAFGWALCLVCFLPFYMSGGMAGGDVKLMAAVGAFLGPVDGLTACLCTLAAGSLIGLLCLGWRNISRILGRMAFVERPVEAGDAGSGRARDTEIGLDAKIPYAGAIAVGATIVVLRPALLTTLLMTNGGWS